MFNILKPLRLGSFSSISTLFKGATALGAGYLLITPSSENSQLRSLLTGQVGTVLLLFAGLMLISSIFKALTHTISITCWAAITGFLLMQTHPEFFRSIPSSVVERFIPNKSHFSSPFNFKNSDELINEIKKFVPEATIRDNQQKFQELMQKLQNSR